MSKKVIHFKYLPSRLPTQPMLILWLLLDRFQPAQWVWGVLWTLYAIVALGSIVAICTQTRVHPSEIPLPEKPGKPQ